MAMPTRSLRRSSRRRDVALPKPRLSGNAPPAPTRRIALVPAWPLAPLPTQPARRPRWLLPGAAILGAFTLTLSLLAWVDRPQEADLSDLIAALPHPRPFVAPRFGSSPYALCERAPEGESGIPHLVWATLPRTKKEQAQLRLLQDELFRHARRQPEARRRHLSALWTLGMNGTHSDLDRAVENLEAAPKFEHLVPVEISALAKAPVLAPRPQPLRPADGVARPTQPELP